MTGSSEGMPRQENHHEKMHREVMASCGDERESSSAQEKYNVSYVYSLQFFSSWAIKINKWN